MVGRCYLAVYVVFCASSCKRCVILCQDFALIWLLVKQKSIELDMKNHLSFRRPSGGVIDNLMFVQLAAKKRHRIQLDCIKIILFIGFFFDYIIYKYVYSHCFGLNLAF